MALTTTRSVLKPPSVVGSVLLATMILIVVRPNTNTTERRSTVVSIGQAEIVTRPI